MLGPILITAAVSFNEIQPLAVPAARLFAALVGARAGAGVGRSAVVQPEARRRSPRSSARCSRCRSRSRCTRYRFRGREALVALTLGPLMLPALVTGVGLLQLFQYVGLRDYIGFTALLVGHVVICLPFAVRTVGDQPAHAAAERRARRREPRRDALAHAAARRVPADQERHHRRRGVRVHPFVHRRQPVDLPRAARRDADHGQDPRAFSSSASRRRSPRCR